jgi:transglutaminase-like putative cysteine protease
MAERMYSWLGRLIVRYWITVTLFTLLIGVVAYSLEQASWVRGESVLVTSFVLGLAIGALLARSRFRGRFAFFYALFIALVNALQAAGKILPGPGFWLSHSFYQIVDELNLRAVNLSLRASGWVQTLRDGGNIEDTGLFVALIAAALTLCAAWLVWSMQRHYRVLHGLLPIGLLLAMNIHLSRQPLTSFVPFLLAAVLLMARTSYNNQNKDWQRRRVDFPEQLGVEWGAAALLLAVVIVLAARLAPLFGTAEGWKILSEWVERTQERAVDTATRLFSGVNTPPPPPDAKPVITVNMPDLSEIGEPIPQGYETIMWVSISDPAPIPAQAAVDGLVSPTRIHYWRGSVYSTYTGRGWERAPMAGAIDLQREISDEPPPGRYYLRQTFRIEARHLGALFSTSDPVRTSSGAYLRQTRGNFGRLVEGQVSEYQVISAATLVTADELAAASLDYPDELRLLYLQLPDSLPDRVRALAVRLAQGEADPYHKAIRIQNYLRENYVYDLSVPIAPPGRDVVDYFLFDAPGGFCSHYATAMTVMLRAVGIPARVVSGYAMGDYEGSRGAYHVPVSASHAWVEVYFPGYGWIEFEPTASRSAIVYSEVEVAMDGSISAVEPLIEETPETAAQPSWIVLIMVIALILLSLPFFVMRMFMTTRHAPAVQVDLLYRRMRKALGWAGLAALPSVTPDEYLALFGQQLASYRQLSQALAQTTQLYRESVFSPRPPEEYRVRLASHLWQQSVQDWLSLWLKTRWQRVRSRIANGQRF